MKRPADDYRISGPGVCMWRQCREAATHGVRLVFGQNSSTWLSCAEHFAGVYARFNEDNTYWPPWSMDCDPPVKVKPL